MKALGFRHDNYFKELHLNRNFMCWNMSFIPFHVELLSKASVEPCWIEVEMHEIEILGMVLTWKNNCNPESFWWTLNLLRLHCSYCHSSRILIQEFEDIKLLVIIFFFKNLFLWITWLENIPCIVFRPS